MLTNSVEITMEQKRHCRLNYVDKKILMSSLLNSLLKMVVMLIKSMWIVYEIH